MSRAPGPPGGLLLGHALEFRRDALGLLERAHREHGDVVRLRLGPQVWHSVADPGLAREILADGERFDKRSRVSSQLAHIGGDSLLLSHGEKWRSRRELLQPHFNPEALSARRGAIEGVVAEMLDGWRARDAATPLDLASEMRRVTFRILERVVLGVTDPAPLADLERAVTTCLEEVYRRIERPFSLPLSVPLPAQRRFRSALARVDARVEEVVERIETGHDRDGLLAALVPAMRELEASGDWRRALRDEVITLLIAGHETTASGLTWFWEILTRHPALEQSLLDEATRGEAGGIERAFSEAMRLRPPIWAIIRRATGPTRLRDFDVPGNSQVIVSPHVLHRHPDHWREPEVFDPRRFLAEGENAGASRAYLPFGAGPRFCLGAALARLESEVVIREVLRSFRLVRLSPAAVRPDPGIALRCAGGLPVRVERR